MSSKLFAPIKLRDLELANRVVVAPMCQYSAEDGNMTDWHMLHLGSLSNSGAGLLIVEATGVEPEGRISLGCPSLANDENEAAMKRVVTACKRYGTAKIGIQLGHAGRKASCTRPWEGKSASEPLKSDTVPGRRSGPSAIPFAADWHVPSAYTIAEIEALKAKFVEATKRADRIGFDLIEIHGAHGYLLHEFVSPLSNKRTDQYGGSLENRIRLPLEIFAAMRAVWPKHKPLGIRISAVDWVEGGLTIEDSIFFAQKLKDAGCDFIDVSSGGNDPHQKIALRPWLSGAVRRGDQEGDRHDHDGGRPDHRGRAGRSDRRRRQGRHGGAGARLPRRSALGLACGLETRRRRAGIRAVCPRDAQDMAAGKALH